jgi:hypothetical protein
MRRCAQREMPTLSFPSVIGWFCMVGAAPRGKGRGTTMTRGMNHKILVIDLVRLKVIRW